MLEKRGQSEDTHRNTPSADSSGPQARLIEHEYTLTLAPLLEKLGISLLVSTYQAGMVVVIGRSGSELALSYHNFDRAMGVAVTRERIAVGALRQFWFLVEAPEIAQEVGKPGEHDASYLTRASHFTGEISSHEIEWGVGGLWVVNTLFSCICTLDNRHSFVPRWKPWFIGALTPEDRCHLNGMALHEGLPRFATCLGKSDESQGWRQFKAEGGCLIDVPRNEVVLEGLCMPHSPRIHEGLVWLLDSGKGRLLCGRLGLDSFHVAAELPGYARGLAIHGGYAFVGLSKIRESSGFGGLPILSSGKPLKCGLAALDLASGKIAAHLEFHSGVEEIFDVRVNPFARYPFLSGPHVVNDGASTIWLVPASQSSN